MSNTVIKVENLSKQYRLGRVSTGTLSHDVNRWWHKVRGKEDPYLMIGESNDRTVKGNSDYVWALQNIDFEVKQGEVLGIIGRNGAGKSTLLKILSRTTAPTTGSIKIKGRVASLLEVGTGFHPELTGRENIFLNGAILGMTKKEIERKFDEIVDFAGVERYIDTPVKRYSSGMYVRLAFAVAAFLEPEILIVDEVLAVGDAEFQKKCLGRMRDVSVNDGRTVLFVSHNMAAVANLCDRCALMQHGTVITNGPVASVIQQYFFLGLNHDEKPDISAYRTYNNSLSPVVLQDVYVKGYETSMPVLSMTETITLVIKIEVKQPIEKANVSLTFYNAEGIATDLAFSWDDQFYLSIADPGIYNIEVKANQLSLPPGRYAMAVGLNQHFTTVAWDGINFYPIFQVENRNNVMNWDFRPWAVHHLHKNEWRVEKLS